jgi:hypothetical protein
VSRNMSPTPPNWLYQASLVREMAIFLFGGNAHRRTSPLFF